MAVPPAPDKDCSLSLSEAMQSIARVEPGQRRKYPSAKQSRLGGLGVVLNGNAPSTEGHGHQTA